MLNSELHRKAVLQLYRSLTRGAQHLPLLLSPRQKNLVHTFRTQLKQQFRKEAPVARDFQRAHRAISTALEWDALLCRAFEDPDSVAPLVDKISQEQVRIKDERHKQKVDNHLQQQFERAENNQNAKFPDFVESYRKKVLTKAESVPISPEEQQHRETQRLHTVLLKRLKSRIPQRTGRSQQLFTQCVLLANRNHQRDVYKHTLKLKRREGGEIVRDQKGSNIPQLVFHRPRHRLAPQSWEFGRIISVLYKRHNNLIVRIKDLEKELEHLGKEIRAKLRKNMDPKSEVMKTLFAKNADVKSRLRLASDKVNHMKKMLASEYPITMRRIKQYQKVVDRKHPELIHKARVKHAQMRADSNLGRLYR
ncbi:hypothetical protein B0I72DRAFT_133864 [Yarrowia lipolytica]|uniref:YALI0F08503p n=2 Tax=Yarrowia lipolytica TaxID=4952 RepID=Q6C2E8_YARLI|nr:YALI0F08503p [Yarrowia lipolytica CLIB122]AOW06857.1 hypothetical protein YALI1_F11905g [Yarrowia lipolytica]KAB8284079.1 hypothetical protein BKA91DRAFT_135708 [Yarrowia lipolytica]KAE8173666.1 hypothetical protein BKA90DRAFT_135341 [Yarrowia lipolytica]KAJ8055950.1 hypothetical protein LXG23DRAFT_17127 [Yarrowia lipolytica]QNQ01266.1 Hypothetical protein YALI2_F00811g [Yarrowia lipolytica]|eukprot:XP_505164.1 YALI0F08503p [Yarrowia lipolytica CLIB122]